jgi:predicted porin
LDVGLAHANNGTATYMDGAGFWDTSVLGIKGSEDLGGGLKSTYQLESGLQVANGTNGVSGGSLGMFNREANVGLAGSFGSIKLGETINPIVLENALAFGPGFNLAFFVPMLAQTLNVGAGNGQGAGFFDRNSVVYTSPNMNGFVAGVSTTVESNSSSTSTVTGSYSNGAIRVGGGYETTGANAALTGNVNLQHTGYVLDASYSTANWNAGVVVNSVDWAVGSVGATGFTGDKRLTSTSLNASYLLNASTRLIGNYSTAKNGATAYGGSTTDSSHLTQVAVQYSLSKQTRLYAFVQKADNGYSLLSTFDNSTGYAASGANATAVAFGITKGF